MTGPESGEDRRSPWFRKLADAPTWVLVLLSVAVLGAVVGGMFVFNTLREPAQAKDECRVAVEDRLKAPATAEFSNETAEKAQGEDEYVVTGEVDSENGFGAMIRNSYTCKVRSAPFWYAYSVTFADD